tara:strand:- start:860 stop:1744 length:885 start_codon:yes stop_codon:yes gene_type:complete
MGTQFTVKAYKRFYIPKKRLISDINRQLIQLSAQFNTYTNKSQISVFNKERELNALSDDWRYLLGISEQLYRVSNGAWDPTVWPLTQLWKFNTDDVFVPPSDSDIKKTLAQTGFHQLNYDGEKLVKKTMVAQLDLSSIAKGYAVDVLSQTLLESGIKQFYVEIGGEIRVGEPRQGQAFWRLGIQDPLNTQTGEVVDVLKLSNMSLATSGTYRQFRKWKGRSYSHIIDPRTGYPISHHVISVSVMHPLCAIADGLATALMVLRPEEREAFLSAYPKAKVLLYERNHNQIKKIELP